MKKALSIFLAALMILAIAVPVFAETTEEPAGNFKVGENYYDDLNAAISAAEDGGTVTMTKDVTLASESQNKYNIKKNITINGGGKILTFTCAANIFPVAVDNANAVVEFTNFANIKSDGGIFAVTTGTLKLNNLTATGKGRATMKTQGDGGTSNIIVENALITFDPSTGSGETTVIVTGSNANDTITLKDGAIIEKTNKANGAADAAAAAIYFMNGGSTQKLIMEAGSKIIGKHASGGNTTASIIGNAGTGTVYVQIAQGAYLINESSNTTVLNFIKNTSAKKLYLTAPEGAFLVKDGLTPTLNAYQGGSNDGGNIYDFVKLETSPVEGYSAYKAYNDPNAPKYFEFINESNTAVQTASFNAALIGAKDKSTIKLIANASTTENNISFSGKTLTIDLNGFTLTASATAYFFGSMAGDLTFANGNMILHRGIVVKNGGTLTFDGVTATIVAGSDNSARPMVKLSGDSTGASATAAKLVVKDSNLKATFKGEALILVEHYVDGTIELSGNTVIAHEGILSGNNQNNGAVCIQTHANLDLTVGTGSTIRAGHPSDEGDADTKISTCIADNSDGDITVTLENGAILLLDRTASLSPAKFINHVGSDGLAGEFTINNKGAKFMASADVAKAGFELPESTFGYVYNGTKLDDNTFVDEEATETVTITEIIVVIDMLEGAAIRKTLPFGLNFAATIDTELYNSILALDPNATIGFVLATKRKADLIDFDLSKMMEQDYKEVAASNVIVNEDGTTYFDITIYTGEDSLIAGDTKAGFKTEICAKAFVKFTVDGEEFVVYTDYTTEDNCRSIYTVATAYYEDATNGSTTNLVINHILEVCGYDLNK